MSDFRRFIQGAPTTLLSHPEVLELARIVQANWIGEGNDRHLSPAGIRARDKICKHNLRLIVPIALAYRDNGEPLEDLLQDGVLGLCKAIERFDPTKGYRLSTYAHQEIRSAIQRAIQKRGSTIRIPCHRHEQKQALSTARRKLTAQLRRFPTADELAEATGMSVAKQMELAEIFRSVASLQCKVGKDRDTELMELLPDDTAQTPHQYCDRLELQAAIAAALVKLPRQQRDVVEQRFLKGRSLRATGEVVGAGKTRVAELQRNAIERLRKTDLKQWLAN